MLLKRECVGAVLIGIDIIKFPILNFNIFAKDNFTYAIMGFQKVDIL